MNHLLIPGTVSFLSYYTKDRLRFSVVNVLKTIYTHLGVHQPPKPPLSGRCASLCQFWRNGELWICGTSVPKRAAHRPADEDPWVKPFHDICTLGKKPLRAGDPTTPRLLDTVQFRKGCVSPTAPLWGASLGPLRPKGPCVADMKPEPCSPG